MRAADPPAVGRGALAAALGNGSLYARLMGDTWFQLAPPIRDFHSTGSMTRAHCYLRVEHGPHPLARIIARVCRLPAPAPAIRTTLSVITLEDGERWVRAFGTTRVETRQFSNGSDLVERYGAVEFRFRLHAPEGRLVYLQRETALRLFALRLVLPGYLAPHVEASEDAIAPERVRIAVSVTLPLIGLLIGYDGTIDVPDTAR